MNAPARRVFIALWPPPDVRARLAAVGDALSAALPQARKVPAGNLHLTLAFVGLLPQAEVAALAEQVETWPAELFEWRIDRVGAFLRAKVVWAGGTLDAPLAALASAVRERLDTQGIRYDRKPFAPHVTLLRDVGALPDGVADTLAPPIAWCCGRPVLVESVAGPRGPRYLPHRPA